MVFKEKKCRFCGGVFIPSSRSQRYCSEQCKERSHYHGTVCVVCGKPTKDDAATCSKECLKIHQSRDCVLKNDDVKKKIKNTLISKYGVDNPMRCKEISHKVSDTKASNDPGFSKWRSKFENTMQEKYGVSNALECQEFRDKVEHTNSITGKSGRFHTEEWNLAMIAKYGTTIPYKNDDIKMRGIRTMLERYGVTSPAKLDWVQEKSKQTCLRKYGVEYSFQSDNNKVKSKQTLMEKYGVEYSVHLVARKSKINQQIGESLHATEYEFPIHSKRYDIKLGNTLIEVNPTVSHNSDKDYVYGVTDKDYHVIKSRIATENGYRCFHIWDWDNIDKIVQMFTATPIKIYARNCDVIFIDKETSDRFLDDFHLQGSCSGDIIRVGLAYDNTLVGVMTFGPPRYSGKYDVELLRMCFRFGYHVIGGASKMLKFFVGEYQPESIVSYCDNSKFTGDIYSRLNFHKISDGKPTPHWYNIKTHKHITDSLLRQRGFDQLLGNEYGCYGKNSDNIQLMLEHGFVRVYDCGQSVYVWDNMNQ